MINCILSVFTVSLLFGSVYDLYKKIIPNYLTVFISVLGFLYNYLLIGYAGLATALYGLLSGFFTALVFYRFASLGAGDVKLFAAIGSFVGNSLIIFIIAYSYMISAILGIAFFKLWLPWNQSKKLIFVDPKLKLFSQRIPMAPGISMATFYILYRYSF